MAMTKALVKAVTKAVIQTQRNGHKKSQPVKVRHVHHHHVQKHPTHTHIMLWGPQQFPMEKTGRTSYRNGKRMYEYRCTFNYGCATAWRPF